MVRDKETERQRETRRSKDKIKDKYTERGKGIKNEKRNRSFPPNVALNPIKKFRATC